MKVKSSPFFSVLQLNAQIRQLVTDFIGSGEILIFPGFLTELDQHLDHSGKFFGIGGISGFLFEAENIKDQGIDGLLQSLFIRWRDSFLAFLDQIDMAYRLK